MVTANVSFYDGSEAVAHLQFEEGAALPREGEIVHFGTPYREVDVTHDYGTVSDGDTIKGGEINIDVETV